ncbi:MAG TPA: hypothetical protein VJN88_07605 [Ktedonobacterales bacterium]|nr:hypothetical protein [Ktedonobacterales bacterium]
MSSNSRGATNRPGGPGQSTQPSEQIVRRIEELSPDVEQILVATVGALLIGVLYIVLPSALTLGPNWLLLVVEAILLAPPFVAGIVRRRHLPFRVARGLALSLTLLVTAGLVISVFEMVTHLSTLKGATLLKTGATLYAINVLVFAVWYWEVDHGGPMKRLISKRIAVDFQFVQQVGGNPTRWLPGFIDYLFLAFCTSTALSPADTMPLTRRAKMLMMTQSIIALIVLAIIVGRSINILS